MCKFLRNFAPDMRKSVVFIVLCLFACAYAHAETLLLRTGARVKGTIVFQNEEVVIIRDAETGARFQYPRADVASVEEDNTQAAEETQTQQTTDESITVPKKVSIALELVGGAAVNPGNGVGGVASADLLVGSHHLANRHLFIGGGLGYHGLFIGGNKLNFLPVQLALRMPFTEQKHAPVFGVAVGYGIAMSKTYTGGIYAGLDLGYRCQLNPKTAIAITLFTQFQQAKVQTTETIEEVEFVNYTGCNFVSPGLKLALFF